MNNFPNWINVSTYGNPQLDKQHAIRQSRCKVSQHRTPDTKRGERVIELLEALRADWHKFITQ